MNKAMSREKKLIKEILSLPSDVPQDVIQKKFEVLFFQYGIESVMSTLFKWELKVGYITKKLMSSNIKLKFYDEKYKLTFRLQVNIARSKYSPTVDTSKVNKKLHCPICFENIGTPGKEKLRAFVFPIDGKKRIFFIQTTPFPLFWNHFVLISMKKEPQNINFTTIEDLFNFTDITPNYTNCSNSDLPWTGASILSHLHYQIFGSLHLPVMDAQPIPEYIYEKDYVRIEPLFYPCGVVRFKSLYRSNIMQKMYSVIKKWKEMEPSKQSVNLIVMKTGKNKTIYEGYVFLRNSDYRTPKSLQKIKSEGIGIIEMAGEAILPVPKGTPEEQKWIWNQIKKNGLSVIKGIIEGNNPIKNKKFWKNFLKEV